jgi:uncharacterized protein YkwD
MLDAARLRYTLAGGITAVVIGAAFTFVGLTRQADAETVVPTSADQGPVAGASAGTEDPALSLFDTPASPSPSATPSASPSASPSATPKKTTTSRKPSRASRSATATAAPAATAPKTGDAILDAVLARINAARTADGLGVLTLDTKLSKAAAVHNQLMIDGCGLEHQCPGEAGLGERFSAQGVQWTAAGENIGFGSSGSSNAQIIAAANGLTDSMLAEVPPNDGHRKNLLSSSFKRIGLSVVRDGKGITWMTQDFGK